MLDDELADGVAEGSTADAVQMHSQIDAMRAKGYGPRAIAERTGGEIEGREWT